jgi:hypothetical protein
LNNNSMYCGVLGWIMKRLQSALHVL